MEYLQTTGKKRKRVGRGIGSGKGKTCGRGTKGQKARKSGHTRPGFEGGQTPIYRRLPKRGPKRSISDNKQLFSLINLADLERNKNILDGQTLDFSQKKEPIKILGRGELTKKLIVRAAAFSQTAQTKILQLGGKIEVVNKIWEPKRKE